MASSTNFKPARPTYPLPTGLSATVRVVEQGRIFNYPKHIPGGIIDVNPGRYRWEHVRWTVRFEYDETEMVETFDYGTGIGIDRRPSADEMLSMLFSDALIADEHTSPESMARELGMEYEEPYDLAYVTHLWRECKKTRRRLRGLFGTDYEAVQDAVAEWQF